MHTAHSSLSHSKIPALHQSYVAAISNIFSAIYGMLALRHAISVLANTEHEPVVPTITHISLHNPDHSLCVTCRRRGHLVTSISVRLRPIQSSMFSAICSRIRNYPGQLRVDTPSFVVFLQELDGQLSMNFQLRVTCPASSLSSASPGQSDDTSVTWQNDMVS